MSDSSPGPNLTMGFLVGAVVGAALGLLFAPRPGREMRALLREGVLDAKDRALDVADQVRDNVEIATEKAQAAVAEARKKADAKIEAVKKA